MKNLPKLSKTSWLFLSIGIFVVIIASLGVTYSHQVQEQEQLNGELDIAEMRVDKLQLQELQQKRGELEAKLEERAVELAAAKDNLRQPVESIDVTDEFYIIAYDCDIEVNSISSSSIQQGKLENINLDKTAINAAVTGRLSDIIYFVTRLNDDLTTGIVNSVQLSISNESDNKTTSASIAMSVYAYEGD